MRVIDIIKDTCTFLQMDEEFEYLNSYDVSSDTFLKSASLNIEKNIELLLKCTSLVVNTICTEYIKLKDSTYVYATDGRIKYSDISEYVPYSIVSVEDEFGLVPFSDFNDEIVVENFGRYKVTYLYSLGDMNLDTDLSILRLPSKSIGYGVASEYLYITKLYDDASIWDTRFKSSLLNLLSNKKRRYIKPRRWY